MTAFTPDEAHQADVDLMDAQILRLTAERNEARDALSEAQAENERLKRHGPACDCANDYLMEVQAERDAALADVEKQMTLRGYAVLAREQAEAEVARIRSAIEALADEWESDEYPWEWELKDRIKAVRSLLVEANPVTDKEKPTECICIRFADTGGFRVADLTCPVHGAGGTEPGDGPWVSGVTNEKDQG